MAPLPGHCGGQSKRLPSISTAPGCSFYASIASSICDDTWCKVMPPLGFGGGPPTEESWWSSGGPAPKVYIKRCPQGHELQPWAAKPGWCDGCGAKIKSGEAVMDCRECNYYLCKYCCPPPEAPDEAPSFWGAMATLTDMGSGPAVSSALDNVALSLGDVIDAATQDMAEMASDFKTFVASAVGLEEEDQDEEAEQQKAAAMKKSIANVSPRSRQEASSAISDFCQKYPAARVRPNSQELDKLWSKIGELKPIALTSAFYDELSFTNGDTSWQPRLRVLYAVEFLYKKDGIGKEVAMSLLGQAKGIIHHLTEVQQCAEKATEVIKLVSGKTKKKEDDGEADCQTCEGSTCSRSVGYVRSTTSSNSSSSSIAERCGFAGTSDNIGHIDNTIHQLATGLGFAVTTSQSTSYTTKHGRWLGRFGWHTLRCQCCNIARKYKSPRDASTQSCNVATLPYLSAFKWLWRCK
eukprot:symbB.v1.2.007279.t1/scaffold438.1/size205425/7